ncbi:MAG: ABC transporter substrate-binding protein [Verrucomicrobiaceae bacterium]|nr:ABC transporter substrate-binding protein [Verrucomicrobiaceae bacterium]
MNRKITFLIVAIALAAIGFAIYKNKAPSTTSSASASGEYQGQIKVGHLVGICMSPLFLADAKGYFKEEGLDVKLEWIKSPSDQTTALAGGAVQFIHNPFTNTYQADANGANLKIIAGSGEGGLVCIVQPSVGITSLAGLKDKKGLKVGSQRVNTLEMAFYRMLQANGLAYSDFNMVYFPDHFSMLAAFQNKEIDIVTHVEPYATTLIQKSGGIPIGTSLDETVWGKGSPDCVVSAHGDFLSKYPATVEKYIRAILKADAFIKEHKDEAIALLDEKKYYKVDKATLTDALPRQMPGVDLRAGVKAMDTAIADMVKLGYMKAKPENVVDLTILEKVIGK